MGILDIKITDPDRPRGNPWFQMMREKVSRYQKERRASQSQAYRLANLVLNDRKKEASMGEIADGILEGEFCESCGQYLGEACGYPRQCEGCKT